MAQREFEVITVIASRKAEFYIKARNDLVASLPDSIDQKNARLRLRRAISELENTLFLGEEEKISRTIDPRLSVSQLRLNNQAIFDTIVRAMTGD